MISDFERGRIYGTLDGLEKALEIIHTSDSPAEMMNAILPLLKSKRGEMVAELDEYRKDLEIRLHEIFLRSCREEVRTLQEATA